MHAAETFDDGSDHLGDLRLIEQIADHGHETFVVRVAQIRERGGNGGRIAIHQRDVRAGLSEGMHHGAAQIAGGSGDDDAAVFKAHGRTQNRVLDNDKKVNV